MAERKLVRIRTVRGNRSVSMRTKLEMKLTDMTMTGNKSVSIRTMTKNKSVSIRTVTENKSVSMRIYGRKNNNIGTLT